MLKAFEEHYHELQQHIQCSVRESKQCLEHKKKEEVQAK